MSQALFYVLEPTSPTASQEGLLKFVCQLAHYYYSENARVYILSDNKEQALLIDEILWRSDISEFTPHNLIGEGPKSGSPIEIGWGTLRASGRRHVLINLAQEVATFAVSFAQVVDFVPCEEKSKQHARERYKIYRNAGRAMQTETLK
ncbi:DNA polymerase III, chi subunit [Aliivibrio wodanis]|uniref:DNA polymerase III, chi subunit n=1 Tax=Aliivibrio wodanis TaxID=80852 RepID=A0A090IN40_9GAMM|nr:DNA polymerase III, chi subunit [Aliivibrio wodanis]VVV05067.1 DNA polymerase III subunit chi [Aliivibrio wodanis]